MDEISASLLVAIMFVTILSLGVAAILASLSELVYRRGTLDIHWIPTWWLILVLVAHLDLFWNALIILSVEDWRFAGFLYMIAGPILLFLCGSLLAPEPGTGYGLQQYFRVSRALFSTLAAYLFWTVGAAFVVGLGWTAAAGIHVALAVLFGVLAFTRSIPLHVLALVLTSLAVPALLVTRAVGVGG